MTGKGGVGKSVLAAGMARCSAERGLRTVLVTLDTRSERHPVIDVPLAYKPAQTSHGFAVSRVDAFQAAAEYARRSLPFGAMYEAFFKGRMFHDFAAAAPGFEELMCLGKLYNLAMQSAYDRVIFDAPSTGHLKNLLAVPAATQRAVRVGPLNHNARKIEDLLLDPDRTRILVATLAEDMPLREAMETVSLCRDELRMGLAAVLVNRRLPRRFADSELAAAGSLERADSLSQAAAGMLAAGRNELAECASQDESLRPLQGLGVDTVAVPRIVQHAYDGDALIEDVAPYLAPLFASPVPVRPDSASPGRTRSGVAADAVSRDEAGEAPELDLQKLVASRRIIVCCGSGGVGKTTSAAALGILAARAGRRVQVMTIDPARRLAQAMGLDELDHEARQVPLDAPGEMWAMMLDSKRAFDRLVESYAPDARVREAIFANHYYQQLSSSLGGSRELVAMERVLEAAASADHDLLIVDTPPSQHALDFLDAPARMISLLDGSMTRMLVRPYGLAARAQFNLFRQSSAVALKFMERFTGVQMLADLSDFLLAFSGMFEGFKERSHRVQALMRDPATAFLLVCAPEPASLAQVTQFATRLHRDGMSIAGVLANRVHEAPAAGAGLDPLTGAPALTDADLAVLAKAGDRAFSDELLPERLTQAWLDAAALSEADRTALQQLQPRQLPLHRVPRFTHDLHSMSDLDRFARRLLPMSGEGRAAD
ncbi:MAG: ArsA-related P-loop ATPase [Gammaproteobacteria bacterium]|nr:ArsA-related P-loop ATPase [Gammaproteobacteria bacterium]